MKMDLNGKKNNNYQRMMQMGELLHTPCFNTASVYVSPDAVKTKPLGVPSTP